MGYKTIMIVDNGSKHLPEIINFLRSRGVVCVRVDPHRFNLRRLKKESIDGVILSGGSMRFVEERRDFNFRVIRLFRDKPLLGICLGHEFLIEYYKGALYKMNLRAQGFSFIHVIRDNDLVKGKKRLYVYKGHSYAAGILPDCFEQLAWSSDCENEMIEHKVYRHFGVQFHPEMSPQGREVLENFLKLCEGKR